MAPAFPVTLVHRHLAAMRTSAGSRIPESDGDLLIVNNSILCLFRGGAPVGSQQRSTSRLRSALVVEIGRNLGGTRRGGNYRPTERFEFIYGQLQLLTETYSPHNWGMLMMGSGTASGAPDGSGKRRKMTHDEFR